MPALVALALVASCARPPLPLGDDCEINSDCADPLACSYGRCRRQCVDSRDCGAGLRCLVDPGSSLGGGCQLEHERNCVLTSDCTSGLVCQSGTCTTSCVEDRDCTATARCLPMDGTMACYEERAELCIYNSDCTAPMICGWDQICRLECINDRDCIAPRVCVASLCELPAADAGP